MYTNSVEIYINLMFDLGQMTAIFDFTQNSMFWVLSYHNTMSGVA